MFLYVVLFFNWSYIWSDPSMIPSILCLWRSWMLWSSSESRFVWVLSLPQCERRNVYSKKASIQNQSQFFRDWLLTCSSGERCREHRECCVHPHHPSLQHGDAHRPVDQSEAAAFPARQVQSRWMCGLLLYTAVHVKHVVISVLCLRSDWCSHHSWDSRLRGSR